MVTTQPHPTLADARAWIEDGIADPDGLDRAGVCALEVIDGAIELLEDIEFICAVETGLTVSGAFVDQIEAKVRTFLQSLKADSREEGR